MAWEKKEEQFLNNIEIEKSLGEQHTSVLAGLVDKNGEGNGTPLQYSCLENPMDGGAW